LAEVKEANMDEMSRARGLVDDGLVSIKEAAAFLRISVASLYTLMGRGQLGFVKLGRSRRIPRKALVELAARYFVGREDA
jgi:excisionase family DNA binding protein